MRAQPWLWTNPGHLPAARGSRAPVGCNSFRQGPPCLRAVTCCLSSLLKPLTPSSSSPSSEGLVSRASQSLAPSPGLSDRHGLHVWSEQVPEELDCGLLSADPPLAHSLRSKPESIFQEWCQTEAASCD